MIDLAPWVGAVPDSVVDRIRAARRVLAVGHENPDADTLGSTLAICRLVERAGRPRDARSSPIRSRRSTTSCRTSSGHGPTPNRTSTYDLLVVSDCGSLDRVGAVAARHPDLFERLPRVVIDHHASNGESMARPTGSIRPLRRPAR